MKELIRIRTIDEYIGQFPSEVQMLLERIRETIRQAAPEATETITYQMPTFKMKRNLVHFAAFTHHIGFYPGPSGISAFSEELKGIETSKGAIRFPLDKKIPYALIKKITLFRVQEENQRM